MKKEANVGKNTKAVSFFRKDFVIFGNFNNNELAVFFICLVKAVIQDYKDKLSFLFYYISQD